MTDVVSRDDLAAALLGVLQAIPLQTTRVASGAGDLSIVNAVAAAGIAKAAEVPLIRSACPVGVAAMATVSIDIFDSPGGVALSQTPDVRTVADITWQDAQGGGSKTVEILRGTVVTVPGASQVQVTARMNGTQGAQPKRVEVVVAWGTSSTGQAPLLSSAPITITAGNRSPRLAIPKWARSLIVLTNTPSAAGALDASFYADASVLAALSSTTNPVANSTPIVGSMEYVDFLHALTGQTITPVWELW